MIREGSKETWERHLGQAFSINLELLFILEDDSSQVCPFLWSWVVLAGTASVTLRWDRPVNGSLHWESPVAKVELGWTNQDSECW